MARFDELNIDAIREAVLPDLEAVAEQIAAGARAGRLHQVEVISDAQGVSVVSHGSFDHWKEWGNAKQPPTAPMRSAASRAGRYVPEGK